MRPWLIKRLRASRDVKQLASRHSFPSMRGCPRLQLNTLAEADCCEVTLWQLFFSGWAGPVWLVEWGHIQNIPQYQANVAPRVHIVSGSWIEWRYFYAHLTDANQEPLAMQISFAIFRSRDTPTQPTWTLSISIYFLLCFQISSFI